MVSAIVLAAGSSRRMGNVNKLLLAYKSKPILVHVIENIFTAGISDVIVVGGYEAENVKNALAGLPVHFILNEDHNTGLTTSIQQGILHAQGNGYMICLADMVLIEPAEYLLLVKSFEDQLAIDPGCICLPAFNNHKGNPVIFSSLYRQAILDHHEVEGCKTIVELHKEHVCTINMNTDHVLRDIDNPEDVGLLGIRY